MTKPKSRLYREHQDMLEQMGLAGWGARVRRLQDDPEARLLEAAGTIFGFRDYESATVRAITSLAGVNVAAVGYYYRSKERLYVEALRHAVRCRTRQVPLPRWAPSTSAATKLQDCIRTMLQWVVLDRAPAWHGRLILREVFQPTAACAEFVREFVRPNFETLSAILHELLPPDVPEARRRLIAFSVMGQILHYRFCRPVITLLIGEDEFRKLSVDVLAEHIAGFTLAALGHGKPGV